VNVVESRVRCRCLTLDFPDWTHCGGTKHQPLPIQWLTTHGHDRVRPTASSWSTLSSPPAPPATTTRAHIQEGGGTQATHAPRGFEDLREGGMAPSELAKKVMTAARTDPAAAHRLVGWYRGGKEGLFQSPGLAFRWEMRAAERGHVEAQSWVGSSYDEGTGVEVDFEAAATWFEKAAEQGDIYAQYNLGFALEQGEGTPQNYELAAKW